MCDAHVLLSALHQTHTHTHTCPSVPKAAPDIKGLPASTQASLMRYRAVALSVQSTTTSHDDTCSHPV